MICIRPSIIAIKDQADKRFLQGDTFDLLAIKPAPCKCNHYLYDIGLRFPNKVLGVQCRCGHIHASSEIGWYASYMFTDTEVMKDTITELICTTLI